MCVLLASVCLDGHFMQLAGSNQEPVGRGWLLFLVFAVSVAQLYRAFWFYEWQRVLPNSKVDMSQGLELVSTDKPFCL